MTGVQTCALPISGLPVEFDAITGEWFKIGVSMQNDTDTDITVYVEVEGVEVRIRCV